MKKIFEAKNGRLNAPGATGGDFAAVTNPGLPRGASANQKYERNLKIQFLPAAGAVFHTLPHNNTRRIRQPSYLSAVLRSNLSVFLENQYFATRLPEHR